MSTVISQKAQAQVLLTRPDAPKVFSPASLSAWLTHQECPLPTRSLTQAIWEWTQAGVLDKINAHVYLNLKAVPRPRADDAAAWLRPLAVVSTIRVLGEAGVLNNPSHFVTAVMPIERSRKSGLVKGPNHTYVFAAIPEALIPDLSDPIAPDCYEPGAAPTRRATPEKAIVDAVYLAQSASRRNTHQLPAAFDWDWSMVDLPRLQRLISHFGLERMWDNQRQHIGGPMLSKPIRPSSKGA